MTAEERKQYMREYAKEYRRDGFAKIVNRRYYLKHREEILLKQKQRDAIRAIYRKKLRNTCES